jgi:hypothetical protein
MLVTAGGTWNIFNSISFTMSSDIKTVSPVSCTLIPAYMLCETFDSLLGHFEIRIRELVNSYPDHGRHIYNIFKAFAENLDQTVKELIYDPPRPLVQDVTSRTTRTTIASDYGFHNALRSSEANDIVLFERTASEPTSIAGDRRCFDDDIPAALDLQVRWPEDDSLDTPSMYQQTPFSGSETPSRSDLGGFPRDISVDPAFLHQRAPELCSQSRDLWKHTSRSSRHASEDFVADVRKPKKRASGGRIEPRPKRSKRIAASNSIRRDQITMPTQYSAFFPSSQFISQTSNFSFQVGEVPDLFKDRLEKQDRQHIPLLTHIFFAIANPDSFGQLFDAMKATEMTKSPESPQVSESGITIAEVVGHLDTLDSMTAISSLLRRLYLLQLFRQRSSLMERMQAERRSLRSSSRTGGEPGKISSLVLTKMTQEAYPSCVRSPGDRTGLFEAKRKMLQNRLHAATNWNTLREEFSIGIIALVPIGGEFQNQRLVVQDAAWDETKTHSLEYLPSRPFKTFISLLKELRGKFVCEAAKLLSLRIEAMLEGKSRQFALKFEQLDGRDTLANELFDSPVLLDLCHPT